MGIRSWVGANLLRPLVEKTAAKVEGVAFVGADGDTILERYPLLKNLPFGISVNLHHIVGKDSDPDLFHDHPWSWSLAFVAVGSYLETMPNAWARTPKYSEDVEVEDFHFHHKTLSLNPISHDTFHRLAGLPDGDAWTIFITGPRMKPDGFMERRGDSWKFYPTGSEPNLEKVIPIPRCDERVKH